MSDPVTITLSVSAEAAAALRDPHRLKAVERLVERMVHPGVPGSPLAQLLEATSRAAREAGLTDEEIDEELAAHRRERRI